MPHFRTNEYKTILFLRTPVSVKELFYSKKILYPLTILVQNMFLGPKQLGQPLIVEVIFASVLEKISLV